MNLKLKMEHTKKFGAPDSILHDYRTSRWKNPYVSKKFWTEGHFYRSVGAVNSDTMKHYIEESQEKHWQKTSFKEKEVIVLQRRINEF